MKYYTVLIAEDDAMVRECYEAVFARYAPDWNVQSYPTAEEAFEHVNKADCLITDYNMGPGMNGLELAKNAKMVNPHLPVYLVSGSAHLRDDFDSAREKGTIDLFLSKPIRASRLVHILQQN